MDKNRYLRDPALLTFEGTGLYGFDGSMVKFDAAQVRERINHSELMNGVWREEGKKGSDRGLLGLCMLYEGTSGSSLQVRRSENFCLCCYLSIASWGFGLSACMICFVTSDAGDR